MPDGTGARTPLAIDRTLTLAEAGDIIAGRRIAVPTRAARDRCAAAEARLQRIIAERRHVYGVTTGFGPLADRLVAPEDGVTLQQNLIHHLASGQGPALGWAQARAMVVARLMSILQGHSGASAAAVDALVAVLASDLAPEVPSRGTVGASGDLTPLAHMVLCLQGRGNFLCRNGTRIDGMTALSGIGIAPIDLSRRDGLALVNGTSAMTGVALCNALAVARLADWHMAATAALAEVMHARAEAWHPELARLRPHDGQARATTELSRRCAGSERLAADPISLRVLGADLPQGERIGQDAYTLRCAPQVIGAVLDTMAWHDRVLLIELNAVTDNPVLPVDGPAPALHGGNFMGQHVALVSDALSTAVTVLAGLAERQVARVTDERLNDGLPAFLHRGRAGLNSGFMGAQVTATAILAEMRATGPASVQSISTNGANQDVVSMGTIAARLAADKIDAAREIVSILTLAVAQAMDIRNDEGGGAFSDPARALHHFVRERVAALQDDRPLGEDIAALATALRDHPPPG